MTFHNLRSWFSQILIGAILIYSLIAIVLPEKSYSVENADLIALKEKVSKGYSSKFCNALGMGLSIESATKLTISENSDPKFNPSLWLSLAFSKENLFNEISKEDLSESISENISQNCGSRIGLYSEKEINEFSKYILDSLNNQEISGG